MKENTFDSGHGYRIICQVLENLYVEATKIVNKNLVFLLEGVIISSSSLYLIFNTKGENVFLDPPYF